MSEHENAHNGSGNRQHIHRSRGDIFGAFCQRMHLARGKIDNGLDSGIAQLRMNNKSAANSDNTPRGKVKADNKARDDG